MDAESAKENPPRRHGDTEDTEFRYLKPEILRVSVPPWWKWFYFPSATLASSAFEVSGKGRPQLETRNSKLLLRCSGNSPF